MDKEKRREFYKKMCDTKKPKKYTKAVAWYFGMNNPEAVDYVKKTGMKTLKQIWETYADIYIKNLKGEEFDGDDGDDNDDKEQTDG